MTTASTPGARAFVLSAASVLTTMALAGNAAAVTINLVQIGGSYDGVFALPGDTLELSIEIVLDAGDTLGFAAAGLAYDSQVASLTSGTEPVLHLVNSTVLIPIAVQTDIGESQPVGLPPGFDTVAGGWEAFNNNPVGTPGPATFSLGTALFALSGFEGEISTEATLGIPLVGTDVLGFNYEDLTPTTQFPSFQILGAPIPEPGTAWLLVSGLLVLGPFKRAQRRPR